MALDISKDSDMSAHLESLARVFADHTPGSPLSAYCSEIVTYGSVHKILVLIASSSNEGSGIFLVHENGPMAHSFACKNQDFEGPFGKIAEPKKP